MNIQPTNTSIKSFFFRRRWFYFLIAILLTIGIFFRFYNLDKKVYSIDESATSLRISGYNLDELENDFFDGKILSVKDIYKYQRLNTKKEIADTVQSLARDEPQLPPLYYTLLGFWTRRLGDSITDIRVFSSVMSLLGFPLFYWLCLELFNLPVAGLIGISLIAVSPFYVLYAQEARMYSLWWVTLLLANVAFIRAIKSQKINNWLFYSFSLALSLFTHFWSLLIVACHAFYIVITQGIRSKNNLIYYGLSCLIAIVVFAVWILTIFSNLTTVQQQTSWSNLIVPWWQLLGSWLINVSLVFVDIPSRILWKTPPGAYRLLDIALGAVILPLTAILIGYSVYFLCRTTPKKIWLFVVITILLPIILLTLPDLILGGIRSVSARYQIPVFIGIQLSISYLLARKIFSVKIWQQKFWRFVWIVLISSGLISCGISSQYNFWWNKFHSPDNFAIARIVNQAKNPLVISDNEPKSVLVSSMYYEILSLSHVLSPSVKLLLFPEMTPSTPIPKIPSDFSDVFLLSPSTNLRERIAKEQDFTIKPVYDGSDVTLWRNQHSLWKLKKKTS